MSDKKPTAEKGMALTVYHVSKAGTKKYKVVPEGNVVKLGENKSWNVDPNAVFAGLNRRPAVLCVDGNANALGIWGPAELTPEQLDDVAENNLVEQVRASAQKPKTTAANWVQIGGIGIILLCVIGLGMKSLADVGDLQKSLNTANAKLDAIQLHQTGGATGQGSPGNVGVTYYPQGQPTPPPSSPVPGR